VLVHNVAEAADLIGIFVEKFMMRFVVSVESLCHTKKFAPFRDISLFTRLCSVDKHFGLG
jgi:hypothetical protein